MGQKKKDANVVQIFKKYYFSYNMIEKLKHQ